MDQSLNWIFLNGFFTYKVTFVIRNSSNLILVVLVHLVIFNKIVVFHERSSFINCTYYIKDIFATSVNLYLQLEINTIKLMEGLAYKL